MSGPLQELTAEQLAFQAAELCRLGHEDAAIVPFALTSIALSLSAKPVEAPTAYAPTAYHCPCAGQCHHSASPCSIGCMAGWAPEPKPDGWHTYHVCGGQLRELTWMRTAATGTGEALCTACGAWVEVLVTPDGSHRVSALTLLRLVREMLVYDAEVPTGRVQGGMAERFARLHRLLDSDVEVPAT